MDAETQTDLPRLQLVSTGTNTHRVQQNSVGTGAYTYPERKDFGISVNLKAASAEVSTSTMKEPPIVSPTPEAVLPPPETTAAAKPETTAAGKPETSVADKPGTTAAAKPGTTAADKPETSTAARSSSSSSSSPPTMDTDDAPYEPEADESDLEEDDSDISGASSDDSNCSKKPKYMVYDDNLEQLLRHCPTFGASILDVQKTMRGSLLLVKLVCVENHTTRWRSQPSAKRHPEGNLLLCAAVFFAGGTYTRFHHICHSMGLRVPSPATYFRIQEAFLYPTVNKFWLEEKERVTEKLKEEEGVTLIGDARCDSPGYSAKYSTYTLMDAATSKIEDFEVIQVSEVSAILCFRTLDILSLV